MKSAETIEEYVLESKQEIFFEESENEDSESEESENEDDTDSEEDEYSFMSMWNILQSPNSILI